MLGDNEMLKGRLEVPNGLWRWSLPDWLLLMLRICSYRWCRVAPVHMDVEETHDALVIFHYGHGLIVSGQNVLDA